MWCVYISMYACKKTVRPRCHHPCNLCTKCLNVVDRNRFLNFRQILLLTLILQLTAEFSRPWCPTTNTA